MYSKFEFSTLQVSYLYALLEPSSRNECQKWVLTSAWEFVCMMDCELDDSISPRQMHARSVNGFARVPLRRDNVHIFSTSMQHALSRFRMYTVRLVRIKAVERCHLCRSAAAMVRSYTCMNAYIHAFKLACEPPYVRLLLSCLSR